MIIIYQAVTHVVKTFYNNARTLFAFFTAWYIYTDGTENKDEQYCWCLNLNQDGGTQLYCQSLGSSPPYTCGIKECPWQSTKLFLIENHSHWIECAHKALLLLEIVGLGEALLWLF